MSLLSRPPSLPRAAGLCPHCAGPCPHCAGPLTLPGDGHWRGCPGRRGRPGRCTGPEQLQRYASQPPFFGVTAGPGAGRESPNATGRSARRRARRHVAMYQPPHPPLTPSPGPARPPPGTDTLPAASPGPRVPGFGRADALPRCGGGKPGEPRAGGGREEGGMRVCVSTGSPVRQRRWHGSRCRPLRGAGRTAPPSPGGGGPAGRGGAAPAPAAERRPARGERGGGTGRGGRGGDGDAGGTGAPRPVRPPCQFLRRAAANQLPPCIACRRSPACKTRRHWPGRTPVRALK